MAQPLAIPIMCSRETLLEPKFFGIARLRRAFSTVMGTTDNADPSRAVINRYWPDYGKSVSSLRTDTPEADPCQNVLLRIRDRSTLWPLYGVKMAEAEGEKRGISPRRGRHKIEVYSITRFAHRGGPDPCCINSRLLMRSGSKLRWRCSRGQIR